MNSKRHTHMQHDCHIQHSHLLLHNAKKVIDQQQTCKKTHRQLNPAKKTTKLNPAKVHDTVESSEYQKQQTCIQRYFQTACKAMFDSCISTKTIDQTLVMTDQTHTHEHTHTHTENTNTHTHTHTHTQTQTQTQTHTHTHTHFWAVFDDNLKIASVELWAMFDDSL